MKKTLTLAIALIVSLIGVSASDEPTQPPAVGGMTSGATIPSPAVIGPTASTPATKYDTGRQVVLAGGQDAPEVDIRVVPVLLPAQQDPDFWPVARVLVANRLGGVSEGVGWSLCRGKIVAANLAAGPTNNWWALEQMIDLMSVDGEDTVDLAGIQVTATSYPSPALNSVYGVGDRGYGSAAIGVRKDGTLVVSGPPTQKVSRVIFITQMALFTDTLSAVESWVNGQGNFTIKYEVRYGTSSYVGRAVVRLYGYEQSSPRLIISRHENHFEFEVVGGDSHRPFYLQSSAAVNGTYQTIGRPVYPGDKLSLENPGSGNRFYRLVDTGW